MKVMAQIVGTRVKLFKRQTLNVWSHGRRGVLASMVDNMVDKFMVAHKVK
jgi:hypothetical protein